MFPKRAQADGQVAAGAASATDAAAWALERFEDYLASLGAEDRARLCTELERLRVPPPFKKKVIKLLFNFDKILAIFS